MVQRFGGIAGLDFRSGERDQRIALGFVLRKNGPRLPHGRRSVALQQGNTGFERHSLARSADPGDHGQRGAAVACFEKVAYQMGKRGRSCRARDACDLGSCQFRAIGFQQIDRTTRLPRVEFGIAEQVGDERSRPIWPIQLEQQVGFVDPQIRVGWAQAAQPVELVLHGCAVAQLAVDLQLSQRDPFGIGRFIRPRCQEFQRLVWLSAQEKPTSPQDRGYFAAAFTFSRQACSNGSV